MTITQAPPQLLKRAATRSQRRSQRARACCCRNGASERKTTAMGQNAKAQAIIEEMRGIGGFTETFIAGYARPGVCASTDAFNVPCAAVHIPRTNLMWR